MNVTMDDADKRLFEDALDVHRQGRMAEAAKVYSGLLEKYPDDGGLLHIHGVMEIQKKNPEGALRFLEQAVLKSPDEASYHNNLGVALLDLKRASDAKVVFEKALQIDPDFTDARFNLGNAGIALKDMSLTETCFIQVIKRQPDHIGALNNLGRLLKESKRREQALGYLKQAVALNPGDVQALQNLIDCQENLSLLDEARENCEALLAKNPGDAMGLLLKSKLMRREGDVKGSIALLENLQKKPIHPEIKTRVRFHLGQGYDKDGCAELAFAAFLKGNREVAERAGSGAIEDNIFYRVVGRDRDWFTAERLEKLVPPDARSDHPSPAFMVGFPRSGTTLFERMLDAHPGVVTTGEQSPLAHVKQILESEGNYPDSLLDITADKLAGLRHAFFAFAEGQVTGGINGRLLIDKMPLNIVDLGLIQFLFPDARVVVSLRDPRDVCLSCFMQNFDANAAMVNFTTLKSSVMLYRRVMDLWLHYQRHSRLQWIDYRYEDLIEDFESVVKDVTDFLGLPWDDQILDYRDKAIGRDISTPSYEDVVKPLYKRAQGRWQRYQPQLQSYLGDLAPFVKAFGYTP